MANANECVIFLHGLARTSHSMQKMANVFEQHGYQVANIDYPSRKHPIEKLAPLAVDKGLQQCTSGVSKVHFITHSLGGILIRQYLSQQKITKLGRIVMLAPPNQGSEVVDNYRNIWGYRSLNGPAGLQLGTDQNSVPIKLGAVDYTVGVIAGTKSINPILSLFLPNPDDGKVSLERTKVAGMTDFIAVPHSHPYIMKSDFVIQNTINFIETGQFIASDVTP